MKITKTLVASLITLSLSGCGSDSESRVTNLASNHVKADGAATLNIVENFEDTIFDKDNLLYTTLTLRSVQGGFLITPNKPNGTDFSNNERNIEIQKLKNARTIIADLDVSDETKEKYFDFIDYYTDLYEKNQAYENGLTKDHIESLVYKKYPEIKDYVEFQENLWGESRYEKNRESYEQVVAALKERDSAYQELHDEFSKVGRELHITRSEPQQKRFEAFNKPFGEKLTSDFNYGFGISSGFTLTPMNADGTCPDIKVMDQHDNVIKSLPTNKQLHGNRCYTFTYVGDHVTVDEYLTPEVYDKLFDLEEDLVAAGIKHYKAAEQLKSAEKEFAQARTKHKRESRPTREDRIKMNAFDYNDKTRAFARNSDVRTLFLVETNEFGLPLHARGTEEAYRFVKAMDGVLEELSFNPEKYFAKHPEARGLFSDKGIYELLNENAERILASATKIEVGEDGGTSIKEGEYLNIPKVLVTPIEGGRSVYSTVGEAVKTPSLTDESEEITLAAKTPTALVESVLTTVNEYNTYSMPRGSFNTVLNVERMAVNQ
ncbi:hypothetical protein BIY21_06860 [Vibrio ponticus]|uniref:Uncharacterized protein n=1 Tax=Vibrio ponticus TaxID=265668 RepID=A0ABX3FLS2_9VIBR|nr:hypothetical protein [Vibrio ponticus]OLQ95164.1 hypothetical protein BIY21_06860 [Vibrio ponticus]